MGARDGESWTRFVQSRVPTESAPNRSNLDSGEKAGVQDTQGTGGWGFGGEVVRSEVNAAPCGHEQCARLCLHLVDAGLRASIGSHSLCGALPSVCKRGASMLSARAQLISGPRS
eukprot:3612653-Rhodomonas_salina.3